MADLTIAATGLSVVESFVQDTQPCAEALGDGDAVRIDPLNGKYTKSNATVDAEARLFGVVIQGGAAGEPRTAIRQGVVDGYDLSALAYDDPVYLSNTDGKLADAPGAVNVVVGRVIRASNHPTLGSADKLLLIDL